MTTIVLITRWNLCCLSFSRY